MAILDTSFLIDVERGVGAAVKRMKELLADREPLVVPAIVALEFAAGSKDPRAAWEVFRESYEIADFTEAVAEQASVLAWSAMRRGSFPGWSDTQVAATAVARDDYIVTADAKAFGIFADVAARSYR